MKCVKCGYVNPRDNTICSSCGVELPEPSRMNSSLKTMLIIVSCFIIIIIGSFVFVMMPSDKTDNEMNSLVDSDATIPFSAISEDEDADEDVEEAEDEDEIENEENDDSIENNDNAEETDEEDDSGSESYDKVKVETSLEEWMERAGDIDDTAPLVNGIRFYYGNYIENLHTANLGDGAVIDDDGFIILLEKVVDTQISKEGNYYTVYGYFDPPDQAILNDWHSNSDGEYGAFITEDTLIGRGLYQDIWDCQRMTLGSFKKRKNAEKFVDALMAD